MKFEVREEQKSREIIPSMHCEIEDRSNENVDFTKYLRKTGESEL